MTMMMNPNSFRATTTEEKLVTYSNLQIPYRGPMVYKPRSITGWDPPDHGVYPINVPKWKKVKKIDGSEQKMTMIKEQNNQDWMARIFHFKNFGHPPLRGFP